MLSTFFGWAMLQATRVRRNQPVQRQLRTEWLEGRRLMAGDAILGLGVIGDSFSDEYGPDSYNYATNWVEALAEQKGVNFGVTGSYAEPRRTGYEFNWARSRATSAALITQGQPFGVSQQVDAGQVSHVVVAIGQNDFRPAASGAYFGIYSQQWSQTQIDTHVENVVANIAAAVRRVNNTSGQVLLSNVFDFGLAPITKQLFPDAESRERVSAVIDTVNSRLSQVADNLNVVLVDTNGLAKHLLGTTSEPKASWTLGGVDVDNGGGLAATNSFVDDKIHPHTLLQSQIANLFLQGFNSAYGTQVDLFTESEAVSLAGLTYVSDTLELDLTPFIDLFANAAPQVTGLPTAQLSYVENAEPTLLAPVASVKDADNLNFARGLLTVTLSGADTNDRLTIVPGNDITLAGNTVSYGADAIGTFSGGTGSLPLVVTLNAAAKSLSVQALVRRIGFSTLGDHPVVGARTASFSLSDGDGGSTASSEVSLAVQAINDAPKLNMSKAINYFEDAPPVVLSTRPTLTDPDSDDFEGAVLTVSNTKGDIDDEFRIGSQTTFNGTISLVNDDVKLNGVAIGKFSGGTGTTPLRVTFNAAARVESALAVVQNITFRARANEPLAGVRSVVFRLTDGDGGTSNAFTKSVTVVLVNDKPTLTLGGTLYFSENSDSRQLASGAVLADADSTDFEGGVLTVTITANATVDDRLLVKPAGSITVVGSEVSYAGQVIGTFSGGSGASPLVVSLNRNATRTAIEALVRSVAIQMLGDAPSTANRTVKFKVTDGDGGTSNVPFKTVKVIANNDAPVLTGGGSVGYVRDDAPPILAPAATVVDLDNELFTGGLLSVALSSGINNGYLDVGGSFTMSGNQVLLDTTVVGTLGVGSGTANAWLQITLTSAATRSIVEQLVRSIRFRTMNATAAESRTATFSLTDGSGGTSNSIAVRINIS